MKHVLIYLTNGDCHSIHGCEEVFCPSDDPRYVRIETGKRTYVFNMDSIEHVELVDEEEEKND